MNFNSYYLLANQYVHSYSESVAPASAFFAVTISANVEASALKVLPTVLLSTNVLSKVVAVPAYWISQLANVKVPAGSIWTHAQGIDLKANPGGSR